MKNIFRSLSCLAVIATSVGASHAATVSGEDLGLSSSLPGFATDFYLFGGGVGTTASVLTDFSVSTLGNNLYAGTGDPNYSSVIVPTGSTVKTGLVYLHSPFGSPNNAIANMATFTLGNSATFNYSDFNVFVLYSNADVENSNTRDLDIALGIGTDATGVSATEIAVTDTNSDNTQARLVEFNIQGLAAGDQFTIAAQPEGQAPANIGAVSFASAPEPSTYALALGGLIFLGLAMRKKFGGINA